MKFTEPWHSIEKFDTALADSIVAELKREITKGHPLFNQPAMVLARRTDCDDVLFQVKTPENQFAVVHLTWTGASETNAIFSRTQLYKSLEDFAKNRMQPDALGSSNPPQPRLPGLPIADRLCL